MSVRIWDTTDKHYRFYDATTNAHYGTFTSLTGGDMTLSMVSYTIAGAKGGTLSKFLPGQISYAPINLACPMSDVVPELTDWFKLAAKEDFADDLRRNCSIAQYSKNIVPTPTDLIVWDLINAIPIALPGYSYNSYQGTSSTKFKIAIQAEEIIINYP